MGNCVSASTDITPRIIVVQAAQGSVVDVEVPISQSSMKVGELMLEFSPGHFVAQLLQADFLNASTGKRATPLGADTDAMPGAVYVLFPMTRLHSRISPQELLSFSKLLHLHDQQLAKAAHSPSKVRVHGLFTAGARVAPLTEEECKDVNLHSSSDTTIYEQASPLQENEQESISYPDCSLVMRSCHGQIQVTKHKPWAPKLQTIQENS